MKYFGEYLVKKEIISAQDLVEAFLDQIMYLPPLPKLIYDQKLLTADQMMNVFIAQQETEADFASACRQLGFWTDEFNAKIEHIYDDRRVPFGQFLIQNGALDVKVLVKALDEFLSQAETPVKKPAKVVNIEPIKIETSGGIVLASVVEDMPTAQNNLSFKVAALDATAREVCDFYTAAKKEELDNLITLIRQNVTVKELAGDFLQDVLKNIHTLKGVARFSKAEIIDFICNAVEATLTIYLKSPFFGTKEVGEQLCMLVNKSFPLLLDVRNSISEHKTEANFWNNVENRSRLDAWTSDTVKLNNLLKGVVNEAQSAMR